MEAIWLVAIRNGNLIQGVVMDVLTSDQILDILEKFHQKISHRLNIPYKGVISKMILRKFM